MSLLQEQGPPIIKQERIFKIRLNGIDPVFTEKVFYKYFSDCGTCCLGNCSKELQ